MSSLNDVNNLILKLKRDIPDPESLFNRNRKKYVELLKNLTSINDKFPSILNIVESDKFDMDGVLRLEYMIGMAEKVNREEIKEHDASVAVGQVLVDDIVKPSLNK
uniref:Uncharacterized protein n=1 Tax=viral metagenome TaxID=1070528 RepID=A0A6C0IW77_9ZZZZ